MFNHSFTILHLLESLKWLVQGLFYQPRKRYNTFVNHFKNSYLKFSILNVQRQCITNVIVFILCTFYFYTNIDFHSKYFNLIECMHLNSLLEPKFPFLSRRRYSDGLDTRKQIAFEIYILELHKECATGSPEVELDASPTLASDQFTQCLVFASHFRVRQLNQQHVTSVPTMHCRWEWTCTLLETI